MKLVSALVVLAALFGIAISVPGAAAAPSPGKAVRPNCKVLLPIAKVEAVMGGAVTLEHFGKSDFIATP
jgi:hypothetical protein